MKKFVSCGELCRTIVIVIVIVIVTAACSSLRQVQVVREVSRDTLYLNHIQYDSIYVDNWHSLEYHPSTRLVSLSNHNAQHSTLNRIDTVFITEKSVEYKYRMLRDTVRVVQIDTIPVIREVEVVKTERYIPKVYKASLCICVIIIICAICAFIMKFSNV